MFPELFLLFFQAAAVPPPKPAAETPSPAPAAAAQRTQLNLLGQTDTAGGESRRNENQQFNQIDTNTVRELNLRLGPTTTVVPEFRPDASYFGAELGGPPSETIHLRPAAGAAAPARVQLRYAHNNSIFSARSFFQVGGVQPARENDYSVHLAKTIGKSFLSVEGRQQKLRGQVNGNVLVPPLDQRTPLATDPEVRAIVQRFLNGYPAIAPNRTDIASLMLNTNAPQTINTNSTNARLDVPLNKVHRLAFSHTYTAQAVEAFQLVAGQNPDTDTRSNGARMQWSRSLARSTLTATSGFDRVSTSIRAASSSLGPTVSFANVLTGFGPAPPLPILRAQNRFRQALQLATVRGRHNLTLGGEFSRNQVNGREQDGDRGILTFNNDFGREVLTNLRLGTPSNYVQALGSTWRGFRNNFVHLYAGDSVRLTPSVHIDFGLRYEIFSQPKEVNNIDRMPFGCDCNNFAPRFGIAYRLPGKAGRLRASYGLHYGEIFATTYGQTRLNPPGSSRVVVNAPDIRNLLGGITFENLPRNLPAGQFILSPDMVTPYLHSYNFSYETELGGYRMQFGYVGSRAIKLFQMWFENRGRVLPGIPLITATVNQRRADPTKLEVFRLLNASQGYYDAGRATVILPRKHRVSADISYWFSKAIDYGNDYTATLAGMDARQGRSQAESNVRGDMRGRSSFDQPHALLAKAAWDVPRVKDLQFTGVWLLKNGTPFNVETGSDGPNFGNVDGQGSDRVNLLDPSVLGRIVGNPDTSTQLLPRSAFSFIRLGEDRGNIGRNVFRRGKIANVNASLSKRWRFQNERSVEIRAESINLLNTPQFAEPVIQYASPIFGRIVNTLNDGRTFRFQLRLVL